MEVVLSLPEGVADWLGSRPWLRVQQGESAALRWDTWSVPLELIRLEGSVDRDQLLASLSSSKAAKRALQVVTGAYLRHDLRDALESLNVGYIDRRGNLHLPWSGGVIHLELNLRHQFDGPQPDALLGLGVHGVRAVQALLTEPDDVQLTHLAGFAELSLSRTHSVLRNLEAEGLVRVTGKGPLTRRHIVDRSRLLDWLAAQPSARRRERQLDVAVYGRTPRDVWTTIRERLERAHIPHGLTGSAAAAVFDVGPDRGGELDSSRISTFHARRRGRRYRSRKRPARRERPAYARHQMVGSSHTINRDGVQVAPLVRVYLDALSETTRRGHSPNTSARWFLAIEGGHLADYDPVLRSKMQGEAARIIRAFGFAGAHVIIIGGLVPSLLVPNVETGIDPHIGTNDLDLCLSVALVEGDVGEYERLETSLKAAGFEMVREGGAPGQLALDRRKGCQSHRRVLLCCRGEGGPPEGCTDLGASSVGSFRRWCCQLER